MSVCCCEVSSIGKQLPQEDLQLVKFALEKYMYIYIYNWTYSYNLLREGLVYD